MVLGWSIKKDHDRYRVIFSKMFKTGEPDAALREQLFNEYTSNLFAHHDAEERLVFPAMIKIPDLKDMALELEEEHRAMKMHIKELRDMGYDSKMWRYRLSPLYSIMQVHWEKEETIVIPFAPEYFPEAALENMGKAFDEMVAKARKSGK
jgi:hemerythrin superfamily protein